MSEPTLDISWERTLKVWWAFTWRAQVGTALLAAVGGVVAALMGVAEDPELVYEIGQKVGVWAYIPISVLAIRMILKKGAFANFRIVLIPRDAVPAETTHPSRAE